jgi:hypothetical protein
MLLRNRGKLESTRGGPEDEYECEHLYVETVGFRTQGLTHPGIQLIRDQPRLLSLALDPVETMYILGLVPTQYARFCATGHLKSVAIARDFFEPSMRFHSFWDLLHFRFLTFFAIADPMAKLAFDEFFDQIAMALEFDSESNATSFWDHLDDILTSLLDSLEVTSVVFENSTQRKNAQNSVRICVISSLSEFGSFCLHRMANGNLSINSENFISFLQ